MKRKRLQEKMQDETKTKKKHERMESALNRYKKYKKKKTKSVNEKTAFLSKINKQKSKQKNPSCHR